MKTDLPIKIRLATEADVPFIFNSWLRSFRQGAMCRGVDNSIYYSEHHKLIEKILKTAEVKLAVEAADENNILGYICYEKIENIFTLHYGYVKHTFRGLGLFSKLMSDTGENFKEAAIASHFSDSASKLLLKYNLVYHPYVLINRKEG